MKRGLLTLSLILSLVLGVFVDRFFLPRKSEASIIQRVIDRSLDKYSIENLSKSDIKGGNITFNKTLDENPDYTSYQYSSIFSPSLDSTQKKVTGMLNIPKSLDIQKKFPLVLMIRGFVDPKAYTTGEGTKHAGFVFAKNGFITIAPDFLGYGESDLETNNVFESRFQTYVTTISLLNSLNSLPQWDHKNVFIWAHSNGGQIALTTLEITGKAYPTTLWAPVSAPFPYSILYYTDEGSDLGKALRNELARFEEIYDVDKYSINNYFDKISKDIAVQLHQGTSDEAVPFKWSDNLNKRLKDLDIKTNYYIYPGTDHNMIPSWNEVVQRDMTFFKNNLK